MNDVSNKPRGSKDSYQQRLVESATHAAPGDAGEGSGESRVIFHERPWEDARDPSGVRHVFPQLVERVVGEVNALFSQSEHVTCLRVGEIVVDRFFDGDAERAVTEANFHCSYAALAEHPALKVGRGELRRAVNAVHVRSQLPEDVAAELSYSHLVVLIAVREPASRIALAAQAVREGWSRDELDAACRNAQPERAADDRRPGRPRKPAWDKSDRAFAAQIRAMLAAPPTAADVGRYGEVALRRARQRWHGHWQHMGKVVDGFDRVLRRPTTPFGPHSAAPPVEQAPETLHADGHRAAADSDLDDPR